MFVPGFSFIHCARSFNFASSSAVSSEMALPKNTVSTYFLPGTAGLLSAGFLATGFLAGLGSAFGAGCVGCTGAGGATVLAALEDCLLILNTSPASAVNCQSPRLLA